MKKYLKIWLTTVEFELNSLPFTSLWPAISHVSCLLVAKDKTVGGGYENIPYVPVVNCNLIRWSYFSFWLTDGAKNSFDYYYTKQLLKIWEKISKIDHNMKTLVVKKIRKNSRSLVWI